MALRQQEWRLSGVSSISLAVLALLLTALPSAAFRTSPHHGFLNPQRQLVKLYSEQKIRLNKVFKATHSRRQADVLIASGRVTVNNCPVTEKGGILVAPFVDVVHLDGNLVEGWESLNAIAPPEDETPRCFEYVKYWKPRGVTCTTDRSIEGNIIDEIAYDGYRPKHRVYPVGRLDKDTSGLILLTNDGRLPNASLRQNRRKAKVYNVLVDRPLEPEDIDHLRNGVVITTVAQRDRTAKPLTAPTLPCQVVQKEPCGIQITLCEGRNRQIRKMLAALGYSVVKLHRVSFGGIRLPPLTGPGNWARLDETEMQIIHTMLREDDRAGSSMDRE